MFRLTCGALRRTNHILHKAPCRTKTSIYEPEYLDKLKPEVPVYELLNIQLKGFDFPVLEKFGRYVHKTAETLNLSVEDSWATPHQALKIQKYKPQSSLVETEYDLNVYERNVQVSNMPASSAGVLIELLQASLPAGVQLCIHPNIQDHQDVRYIPDLELEELQKQLDEIVNPPDTPHKQKKF
jgi:large subunit ribosomal protein L48